MVFSRSSGRGGGAAPRRAAVRAAAAALLFLMAISTAKALAPLLLLPPAIEVLSGVMTMRNFITASVAAHAAVALLWGNKDQSGNPPTTSSGAQFTVYIDPKKPLTAPSGWSDGQPGSSNTGGNPQPSPPNSAAPEQGPYNCNVGTYSGSGSSPSAACGAALTAFIAGTGTSSYYVLNGCSAPTGNGTLTSQCTIYRDGAYNSTSTAQSNFACPSGYALNASTNTCTLTDQSVVLKPFDQNCGIVRTGNTFGADPRDPDCNNMSATMPTPSTIQLKKNNESLKAQINADGSVTTTMSAPDANGNTVTTIINFAPPGNSMGMPATGFSESTTQGSGDLNNPGVQIPKLDLPTDYNREATQQQIRSDVGAIKDELKQSGPDLANAKSGYDSDRSAIENTLKTAPTGWFEEFKNKWFAFNPAIQTAECTAYTGNYKGLTFSMDFCSAVRVIRAILGLLAYMLTLWALYRIALGTRYA